jgi:hypothetical protein
MLLFCGWKLTSQHGLDYVAHVITQMFPQISDSKKSSILQASILHPQEIEGYSCNIKFDVVSNVDHKTKNIVQMTINFICNPRPKHVLQV